MCKKNIIRTKRQYIIKLNIVKININNIDIDIDIVENLVMITPKESGVLRNDNRSNNE